MAQDKVHCVGRIAAKPVQVWARLRDFCAPWHPAIATMKAEAGGQIRAFSVQGEDTVYRERLTWFSDTGMSMAYTHVQGIEGAHRYEGRLSGAASEQGGSVVTMSAEIEATAARVSEIVNGTKMIFEMGLAALAKFDFVAVSQQVNRPAPVVLQSRTFDDLPRLALSETPKNGGPLCLFLHGIGGNRSNWDVQLGQVGHVMHAAALDLRGYGDSTLGAAQSTVDEYCDDILRVREVLGADKLVLCGLSYGSWIATSFAEKYPELMAGLVLAGGCTGMSEAGPEERDAFRISREVPLNEGQTPADFAPAVMDVIAGPNLPDAIKRTLIASMAGISVETYRDALRCFTNPLKTFDFSKLTMPVLMMTGEHDRLAPPAEIKSVATRIYMASQAQDMRFEVIAGAGHICNVEGPKAFNRPLIEFLKRVVA